ncbi:MAG TPA: element excision factor XisH family protein [Gemmataceae bacterium]|nr:element excision factor XisH family protein [Gemmataceae bacterium]
MPARNVHHAAVVRAMTADGWTITHDPYPLSFAGKDLFVDLGAEEPTLAAEKEGQRIAVEIQSFLGRSPVRSLEEAVGQYEIYRLLLAATDPGRELYMAVSIGTYRGVLADPFGQLVVSGLNLRLLVFEEQQERIVQWIG